jgi:hypothetical protein
MPEGLAPSLDRSRGACPKGPACYERARAADRRMPLFAHRHLLGIEGLSRDDIETVLDLADT